MIEKFSTPQIYHILIAGQIPDTTNEFFHAFVVLNDDYLVYKKSDPNKHTFSKIDNNYLFHGRTYEPEVGLYYYRNRYYLPRIGRFLQTDPMGYEDSMNLYQGFGMNPINFGDPLGLKTDFNYFGTKKSFSQALNSLVVTDADKRLAGRIAEGGANLIPALVYWIQDLTEVVTGGDFFEDDWRFRFNFSESGSIIQLYSMEKRTYWEKVRDATILYPTGKFIADTGANFILGYNDPYVMHTPVGQQARENLDRQLIPLALTGYGAYKLFNTGIVKSPSRISSLRDKYNIVSREQLRMNIDELTGNNYQRILEETIRNNEYSYRYLSEEGLSKTLISGKVRGYMTDRFTFLSSEAAKGTQIMAEWGVPKYGVAFPNAKLLNFRIARPFGDTGKFGWELITNSYPKAGSGHWLQFLGEAVLKDVFIFTLK